MVPLGEQGEDGFAFPEDTKSLQRHLCVCQLSRALGLHHSLDVSGKLRLIAELKAHYHHGLKFGMAGDCFCLFFILYLPFSIVRCSEDQSKEKREPQKTLQVHHVERSILEGSIIDAFSAFSCFCFWPSMVELSLFLSGSSKHLKTHGSYEVKLKRSAECLLFFGKVPQTANRKHHKIRSASDH